MNNKMNPKVTIVTPVFNSEEYLTEALKSVLNQSYENWELIIVNDGSTDDSEKIVRNFLKKDKRISYFSNNQNKGFVYSLNKGIGLGSGRYIARLDADDVWLNKDKLKKQIDIFEKNKNLVLIGSWGYRLKKNKLKSSRLEYPVRDESIRKYILIENCFIHSSVIFRKNIFLKSGEYEKEFSTAEDYALWLKLGSYGEFYNIPEYMVGYRVNENGLSATQYDLQIRNSIKAVKKYGEIYSFYYLSMPLWYLRRLIPKTVREPISSIIRKSKV